MLSSQFSDFLLGNFPLLSQQWPCHNHNQLAWWHKKEIHQCLPSIQHNLCNIMGTYLEACHQRRTWFLLLLHWKICFPLFYRCLLRGSHPHLQQWPCHNHNPLAQWPQREIHLHLSSIQHNPWSTLMSCLGVHLSWDQTWCLQSWAPRILDPLAEPVP